MFDISKFKEKFIEEAYDLINQLEEALLDQEDDLTNKENVKLIFRVLHTLKGTSAMYGYTHIGDLVHDLESIFDLIREDKQDFTTDIFEITLKIVDHLRNLLSDEKLVKETNQIAQKELLDQISEIVELVLKNPQKNGVENGVEETAVIKKETYYIIFQPTESQLFRCINILQIFNDLADLGEYKIVNHLFRDAHAEDQELNAWGVYLVTDQGKEAIEDVFMFVLDDCKILKVSPYNLFNQEDFLTQLDTLHTTEKESEKEIIQRNIDQVIEDYSPPESPIAFSEAELTPIENQVEDKNNETMVLSEKNNPTSQENSSNEDKQAISRINIDSSKLDQLMYLVSELVITKSQLNLIVETRDYNKLAEIAEKIDDLSRSFRDNALNIRLVPVAEMVIPFKRLIRDLSKDLGKEVKFITKGVETELDKNVLDRLSEPIMHIIRNSIDHGIEKPEIRTNKGKTPHGNIKFSSFYSGANVYIKIEDDGAGIDTQKIRQKAIEKGLMHADDQLKDKEILELIFSPGFSMADKITEVSGRGVGMDVVRKKINELRGEIDFNSTLNEGTSLTIKLHQTLSIIDTLLIKVENTHYLIPIADIESCEQENHNILYRNNNRQVQVAEELIPFISLRDLLGHPNTYPEKEKLVVINKNDKRIAIVVDCIVGEHQAVLKPLGEIFQSQKFLSGASFLGDGTLALMLDTNSIGNKEVLKNQQDSRSAI